VLPPVRTASVWIYGVGLVSMFAMSAAYNFWPNFSAKLILRRFDQSAIFLFIAATYTPFIALARAEPSGALLAGVWAVALIGVVLKLGCPGRFERLAITLCLALGWSGLLVGIRLVPPVSGHAHPKRWRSLFIGRGVSPLGPTPISERYLARVRAPLLARPGFGQAKYPDHIRSGWWCRFRPVAATTPLGARLPTR